MSSILVSKLDLEEWSWQDRKALLKAIFYLSIANLTRERLPPRRSKVVSRGFSEVAYVDSISY